MNVCVLVCLLIYVYILVCVFNYVFVLVCVCWNVNTITCVLECDCYVVFIEMCLLDVCVRSCVLTCV